jgi:chromosome segregation ATPase
MDEITKLKLDQAEISKQLLGCKANMDNLKAQEQYLTVQFNQMEQKLRELLNPSKEPTKEPATPTAPTPDPNPFASLINETAKELAPVAASNGATPITSARRKRGK